MQNLQKKSSTKSIIPYMSINKTCIKIKFCDTKSQSLKVVGFFVNKSKIGIEKGNKTW